ncbi:uncharacterized protein [Rutidosis leptorrhynchoides]|uniref:uncharacterized protein n=1 Tax=Rutidosis leptorrhynchoides TaxID=125765 RepID=UPI003A99DDC7
MTTGVRGSTISDLIFADDSLLFMKATSENVAALLDILRSFELASGQKPNLSKSAILFRCLVDQRDQLEILSSLGIQEVITKSKYLDMPLLSVVQAIPSYLMSCFKLPKGVIRDIEVAIRSFLWGERRRRAG